MASSENLASIEPWIYRPMFADSWRSNPFTSETDALTQALQNFISDEYSDVSFTAVDNPIAPLFTPSTATTSQSGAGSDHEPEVARPRDGIPIGGGKSKKRRSRSSKRTITTFITADPANFRQMVQQVTGARFGGGGRGVGHFQMAPVLKPEPQRPVSRVQGGLPTLDTSAFLLDHPLAPCAPSTAEMAVLQPCPDTVPPPSQVADGFDFESFPSFPTLESWN